MGREILYKLIERIDENDIEHVYFFLSHIAGSVDFSELNFPEEEPLPDEIEAIKEYEEAKARGEKFYTHEEVFGEKPKTKVA